MFCLFPWIKPYHQGRLREESASRFGLSSSGLTLFDSLMTPLDFLTKALERSNMPLAKEEGAFSLRKIGLGLLLCFALSLVALAEKEKPLRIKSSLSPTRLFKAQEGKVVLELNVDKGIAISSNPSFIIEFNPCEELIFPKNFFTASDLEIETTEENGHEYLNLKEPIEIPFTVSTEAKGGRHILRGKIKYFARSTQEGWCLKVTSEFSTPFYTRQTVLKKSKKTKAH